MHPIIRALIVLSTTSLPLLSLSAQIPESTVPRDPAQGAPSLPPEVGLLDDEKLDQFAHAYVMVDEIHTQAERALATTEDLSTANRVKQEAQIAMIQAVERSGLVLAEFNRIAELTELNPELEAEVARRVEQRKGI